MMVVQSQTAVAGRQWWFGDGGQRRRSIRTRQQIEQ
jgi:hypothetical protein